MSASVENGSPSEATPRTDRGSTPAVDSDNEIDRTFGDDNILIDAHEDRWHWRRKIRRDPRKLVFYRFAVAIAGLFFVVLGFLTGPIPGPGGIPLVLLGLAIWSSEFEWAHRLMQRFKGWLHRFRSWPTWQQVLFWAVFVMGCGLFGYCFMLAFGVPTWAPTFADQLLQKLPGI